MRRLRDALAPIARSGGGASSSSATRARAYSSIIAASRPWRVAADAGIATGGGETIGLGIPGGFGSDARRGFVAASARRGLPAWARTNDEEKRDDADARDVDIAKRQAWGGHYRRHFHATSRAGMAVKIPRGLGSASKQKGGSEKAKATDADGFDAASGISRDAKSKRTDAANDVRALHAVNVAIKANTAIFACKLGAYAVTGSSAMLAEAVHSVADVVNQGLLHVGINSSTRAPDAKYNYGYRRERFVWSLISAVGVFFMGSGVSVAHGVHSAWNPMELEHIWIGLGVLGASAAIDSYSLLVAYRALVDNAAAKEMTLREFVESGHDPTSVAVVAEDLAAVSGCAIAAGALFATQVTGNAIFDAAGSVAVGGLLGLTATYLINANRMLLLGRSLGSEKMDRIQREIRADPVVEEVYRAKSEELGPGTFRFVAEIEFSGTKVVERYLDQGDGAKREQLHGMFRAAAAREEPVDLDAALKMYGEEVVTAVGDEVDRIEKAIVRVEPSIHYVDLETN